MWYYPYTLNKILTDDHHLGRDCTSQPACLKIPRPYWSPNSAWLSALSLITFLQLFYSIPIPFYSYYLNSLLSWVLCMFAINKLFTFAHDGVQNLLHKIWHLDIWNILELKELEKWEVQGGSLTSPSFPEAGHKTLMWDVSSLFLEKRHPYLRR